MGKSYLYFDTETTGFYHERLNLDDQRQPHLVQLAAILVDADGNEAGSMDVVVQCDISIPEQASNVHGISNEYGRQFGIPNDMACDLWAQFADKAATLVAHNIDFDFGVMKVAFGRRKKWVSAMDCGRTCTMNLSTPIINLPPTPKMIAAGFNKPKPPKLAECIKHFFGEDMTDAHDALADVRACRRVHQHLLTLNPNL